MREASLLLISLAGLFVTFVLSQSNVNPACGGKRYMCLKPGQSFNSTDICVHVNDTRGKVHLLQTCPSDKPVCPYETATWGTDAICQTAVAAAKLLPGEPCKSSAECYSSNCVKSTCVGKSATQTCIDDRDCDIGLFCNDTNACETQKQIAENCTRDLQCVNNCACNLKQCVYYYSFADNLTADNPKACSSGYTSGGKCKKGLVSLIKGRPCSKDSECLAVDEAGVSQQYGTCQCGYNGGGFSYCPLAEGDSEFARVKDTVNFLLFRSQECHTTLRFGPCHGIYDDEYRDYMKAYLYFYNYTRIEFNDACIKKIYTQDYWQWASSERLFAITKYTLLIISIAITVL